MVIVEAIEQGREFIMAAITLYLSLVTGYLVAVYYVGKNMSNLQAGIIAAQLFMHRARKGYADT